jgi:hypothetical protein
MEQTDRRTHQPMDPEIPLSQAEEEKSPARVRKTLNAAFDLSEKLIRSCSLF